MPEQTNNPNQLLRKIDDALRSLAEHHSFQETQAVINAVIALLGVTSESDGWRLFSDSAGKIRSNGHWFMPADGYADRRAVYEVAKGNNWKLDFKAYWVQNTNKSVIHWVTAITPNFEDAPWLASENVGIDFVIPEKADRVFVVLSKEHALRVIELRDHLSPTASEIFSKWTQSFDFSNKAQLHQILWDSFNFEAINKVFYKTISSFFTELKQHLLSKSKDLFDDHSAALFVNRLIGRIIFCWFIDKKGILNTEINYFQTNGLTASEHYRTKLETLFFRILNTPVDERLSGVDIKTPFLNGGLFEAKTGDHEGDTRVSFPADYFDRLYEFLRRYNFTTDESSSTFQQVAIDPEMLGRIFENLLAEQIEETGEQARKAKGAFYTPREIVDYMCKESLREYLRSRIPETMDRDEQLAKLLDKKPHEFRDQQRNYRGDLKPYKHDILEALEELTVLDPACGSGAFPMGMLQLLLETYDRLESDYDPYKKKLTIIKNNIFGVDIEPMAVEIARLRAWLSIIVDEDVTDGRIEPLPNLDFKFVCANTLIPLDHSEGLYDTLNVDQLIEIRDEYFRARKYTRKQELREKFSVLIKGKGMNGMFASEREKQLKTYQPFNAENSALFFDSRVMFGMVDGFNIVIGNPPYISHDKFQLPEEVLNGYRSYQPFADLYCYFFELAIFLTQKKHGVVSFITSNSYIKAEYGKGLRKLLSETSTLINLINIDQSQVFESATVNTAILISKSQLTDADVTIFNAPYDNKDTDFRKYIQTNSFSKKSSYFTESPWLLIGGKTADLIDKIRMSGKTLEKLKTKIRLGLATGANEAFVLSEEVKQRLIEQDPRNAEVIKPVLRGRDISRFSYRQKLYILLTKNGIDVPNDYPFVYEYLKSFGEAFMNRGAKGQHWTNLRACAFFDDFKKDKIVWIELTTKSKFAMCKEEIYLLNSCYFMLTPDGYNSSALLGVLNSKLIQFYMDVVSQTSGMGTNRWINVVVKDFPVPDLSNTKEVIDLAQLVDEITNLKHADSEANTNLLESQVNRMVYELYRLSDEEIMLIEGNQN